MKVPKEHIEEWLGEDTTGTTAWEHLAQRAAEWALQQPVSMEPVAIAEGHDLFWIAGKELDKEQDHFLYTAAQLAAARQQGAEEERKKHCACQWDADDNRTHTCVRHQGWLDVIEEWSSRAKDAEKCEDAYAKRIAELEKSNAQLLEALKSAEPAIAVGYWLTRVKVLEAIAIAEAAK